MKLKSLLSLLLVFSLAVAFTPPPLETEINVNVSDGSNLSTCIITASFGAAPAQGTRIICVIDIDSSSMPKSGTGAAIKKETVGDGTTKTFRFELPRPDRGNDWFAYVSGDGGVFWRRGASTVSPLYPWEPGLADPGDNVVAYPEVSVAGPNPPAQLPTSKVAALDFVREDLFVNEESAAPDVDTFHVAGYSLDGGKYWRLGYPSPKKLVQLLRRGGSLVLTDKMNARRKIPYVGKDSDPTDTSAVLLTFPKVNPAPRTPRLIAVYDLLADPSGATEGAWTLAERSAPETEAAIVRDNLRVAWLPDGKNPAKVKQTFTFNDSYSDYIYDESSGFVYGRFHVESGAEHSNGVEVTVTPGATLRSKPGRQTYAIRLAPAAESDGSFTPFSRLYRIRIHNVSRGVLVRPNYNKEVLKLRGGMTAAFGTDAADLTKTAEQTADGYKPLFGQCVVNLPRKEARQPVSLAAYLDEEETVVTIWQSANNRRPAGMKQTLKLAPRAVLVGQTMPITLGRVKPNKRYEYMDPGNGSFKKTLKAVGGGGNPARLKNTARWTQNGYTGRAASRVTMLDVVWGEVKGRRKDGVQSAALLTPAEYAPYLVNIPDAEDGLPALRGDDDSIVVHIPATVGSEVDDTLVLTGAVIGGGEQVNVELTYLADQDLVAAAISGLSLTEPFACTLAVQADVAVEKAQLYAAAGKFTATIRVTLDANEP